MASDNLITEGLTGLEEVAPDILSLRTLFVNVVFIGEPGSRNWVLVDTEWRGSQIILFRLQQNDFKVRRLRSY